VVARLHADPEEMVSKELSLLVMATTKDHPVPEAARETTLLETITSPTNVDKTTKDIPPESPEEEVTTTNRTTGNQDKTDPEVSIAVVKTEVIAAIVAVKATAVTRVVTVVAASTAQEVATQLPENDFNYEMLQPNI